MMFAPVLLVAYNRPEHLKRTLESLAKNEGAAETDLTVVSDGAKNEAAGSKVEQVRVFLRSISENKNHGFKSIRIFEREKNIGLAQNVITGVTEMLKDYPRVIVLEDDMLSSRYFLRYMNDALDRYENEENVISIHGYSYPVKKPFDRPYFIRGADCWGWGTWRRGWNHFEPNGTKLLQQLKEKNLTSDFNFNDTYPYVEMLEDQIAGKNNSWAIRWYASAFLKDKLTLYPHRSMIANFGLDGTGTHHDDTTKFEVTLATEPVTVWPEIISESVEGRSSHENYFRSVGAYPKFKWLVQKIKKGTREIFS